jgi:rhamnosyltransferase
MRDRDSVETGAGEPGPAPLASVIMRAKNSDWVIAQALAGLFSQRFRDFELLVVDSGSTDRTLEVVRQYPGRLERIDAKEYYPGLVLNRAIAATRGEVVVFLNSDCVCLSPETLGRLVAAFDDPSVQAAFARQLPRPEAHDWVRRDYAIAFPPDGPAPAWLPMSLPLAAMRRSAWSEQPFYTEAWGSEDTEWGTRARARGWTVAYVADALVMHSHNYTLSQLYGRRFIEGEADAFIHRDHASAFDMAVRTLRSAVRDTLFSLRRGHLAEAAMSLPRRAVYSWAHFRGHRLGESRLATGNRDASIGQAAVLSRYSS